MVLISRGGGRKKKQFRLSQIKKQPESKKKKFWCWPVELLALMDKRLEEGERERRGEAWCNFWKANTHFSKEKGKEKERGN